MIRWLNDETEEHPQNNLFHIVIWLPMACSRNKMESVLKLKSVYSTKTAKDFVVSSINRIIVVDSDGT